MLIRPIATAGSAGPSPIFDVKSLPFAALSLGDADLSEIDLVIAPLFGEGFDAVDLIEDLGRAGFRGRLRISAPNLPNLGALSGELRAFAEPFGIAVDFGTPAPSGGRPERRPVS
jgi:hypothetical protein